MSIEHCNKYKDINTCSVCAYRFRCKVIDSHNHSARPMPKRVEVDRKLDICSDNPIANRTVTEMFENLSSQPKIWGDIQGDIHNQKDLIELIKNTASDSVEMDFATEEDINGLFQ